MDHNIKLTPDLAECIGIHAGDGYLRYHGFRKELDISGGYEEQDYYDNHVIPLFNRVFGLEIKGKFFPSRSTYGFVIRERTVLNVFKQLGFPSGAKSLIVRVPDVITNSTNGLILARFLRGYFDTDGCVVMTNNNGTLYPRLEMKISPSPMQKQFINIVNKFKFRYGVYNIGKGKVRIQINGKKQLKKWTETIGFSNPKHQRKAKIFLNKRNIFKETPLKQNVKAR